jgi:hypothetical protein
MFAWDGSGWGSISSTAAIFRYKYTAAGGETSESGLDDNGITLSYIAGKEQVYLNGVLLVRGTDYTASNGTSIDSLAALAASDVLEIITFTAFDLATAIDKALFDAKGDILVATAADTPGKLTVGVDGYVLKANSATATGLEWGELDDSNAIQNAIVDAKGDIVAASADNTPARLPVGNDGDTLVADSSTTTGLRYGANFAAGKNKIINGDFYVNQRGFTSTTTNNAYGFDRFRLSATGGTVTYSAQTFTLGTAPVAGYEGKNFARIDSTGQSAAGDRSRLDQYIESVRTLAGQTATISFWAKAASGTPKVSIEFTQVFGTGGSPSAAQTINGGQVTLSTSWTRFSTTVSVLSISGRTIGTNNDDALILSLWTSAGTTWNSRTGSLGIQTATIDFWGVQVEQGATATAFQTATGTIQGELGCCQRYYQFIGGTASGFPIVGGYTSTATTNRYPIVFPVQMRISPTITKNGTWNVANTGQPAAGMSNTQGFSIESLGTALGNSYIYPDSTDDTFTMSAEL